MSSFTRASSDFIDAGVSQKGLQSFLVPEGFMYEIGYEGSGLIVHVPTGFRTTPSWPKWLKRLLPRGVFNRWRATMIKSAAVHDKMREDRLYPKHTGDLVFCDAMYAEGTPPIIRELAFVAVRLNGSRRAWNQA